MATKVDSFVTEAAAELTDIRRRIEQVALDAQVLANRWTALGKTNMPGWAEYNWEGMQFRATEMAVALNSLALVVETADAVTLQNMHTALKPVDRIVKAGL